MNYILFTTTRCPKCPAIKKMIKELSSFEGVIYNELSENFADIIQTHNITSAPVFLVFDKENQEIFRNSEEYEIQNFLTKNAI